MFRATGFVVWTLVATAVIAGVFEFPTYGRVVIGSGDLFRPESYLLLWALITKTLIVWAPCWGLSLLLAWRRAHRLEGIFSMTAATLIAGWLVLDSRVLRTTGNHLSDYVVQSNREAIQFAGGTSWMISYLARWTPVLVLIIAGTLVLFRRKAAKPIARLRQKSPRTCYGVAILVVLAFAFVPIFLVPGQRNLLRRLEDSLPMEVSWIRIGGSNSHAESFVRKFEQETERALFPPSGAQLVVRSEDETFQFKDPQRRHVILIMLESLRASAFNPEWMPALTARAKNGLQFPRHFSGANNSVEALFELLYGRTSAAFNLTLDRHILPTAATIFRRNGYGVSYIATLDDTHRIRGQEYLNHRAFPRLEISAEKATGFGEDQWVERDRWSIGRVREILANAGDQPQFVVLFLASTHHPYRYPSEFERFKPVLPENWNILVSQPRAPLLNRYANSVGFIDAEVDAFLHSLDPDRNIVAVVGDHGEALMDDGTMSHSSRLSSAQTRVPMFFYGAGITPGLIEGASTHADLLPTLLHVITGNPAPLPGLSGVDLLDPNQTPRQEVLLVMPVHGMIGSTAYRVGIVRDEGRIALTVNWTDRTLRVGGVLDDAGRVTDAKLPDASDASRWSESLVQELRRLFR